MYYASTHIYNAGFPEVGLEKKYAISNVDQMTHIIGHSNRKKDSTNGRSLELNLIIIPSYSHFVNGT